MKTISCFVCKWRDVKIHWRTRIEDAKRDLRNPLSFDRPLRLVSDCNFRFKLKQNFTRNVETVWENEQEMFWHAVFNCVPLQPHEIDTKWILFLFLFVSFSVVRLRLLLQTENEFDFEGNNFLSFAKQLGRKQKTKRKKCFYFSRLIFSALCGHERPWTLHLFLRRCHRLHVLKDRRFRFQFLRGFLHCDSDGEYCTTDTRTERLRERDRNLKSHESEQRSSSRRMKVDRVERWDYVPRKPTGAYDQCAITSRSEANEIDVSKNLNCKEKWWRIKQKRTKRREKIAAGRWDERKIENNV